MYQTDFDNYIRKDGCLFAELVTQMEIKAGRELIKEAIVDLADRLNDENTMTDMDDTEKKGMYVWSHVAVANAALEILGVHNLHVKYTGRIYMPWVEDQEHTSFGGRSGDFIILQIKTLSGAGHFRGLNHDPWRPARDMKDLKSIRYYQFKSR